MGATIVSHRFDQLLDLVNGQMLPRSQRPVGGTTRSDCSIYTSWATNFRYDFSTKNLHWESKQLGLYLFYEQFSRTGLAENCYFFQALDKTCTTTKLYRKKAFWL